LVFHRISDEHGIKPLDAFEIQDILFLKVIKLVSEGGNGLKFAVVGEVLQQNGIALSRPHYPECNPKDIVMQLKAIRIVQAGNSQQDKKGKPA
jgi:hypothetical protein